MVNKQLINNLRKYQYTIKKILYHYRPEKLHPSVTT